MHYTAMLALPRRWATWKRPRARRSCSSASRPRSRRRRSPASGGVLKPEDNNERQLIHDHEACRRCQRAPKSKTVAIVTAIGLSAAALVAQPLRLRSGQARPRPVHRRHRRRRHQVHAQQRRAGQEVAARDAWARAARSSTPTATAGPTCSSSTAATGRRARDEDRCSALYRNNRQRHVHQHHGRQRSRRRAVRHGRRRGRLRQRRPRGPLHHRSRGRPAVPQRRRRQVQAT